MTTLTIKLKTNDGRIFGSVEQALYDTQNYVNPDVYKWIKMKYENSILSRKMTLEDDGRSFVTSTQFIDDEKAIQYLLDMNVFSEKLCVGMNVSRTITISN